MVKKKKTATRTNTTNDTTAKSKYKSNKYKQGRISNIELEFVKKNLNIMTDEEMAAALQRRVEKIQELRGLVIAREHGVSNSESSTDIARDIRKRPEWPILKQQFSTNELNFFVYRYSQLINQFGDSSTATEEVQLIQAIQIEIFMNRSSISIRESQLRREELELALQELIEKAIEETDPQLKATYNQAKMETQGKITAITAGIRESTKQFKELHASFDAQMKALKATRDQRLDKVESAGKTIFGLIRYLDERENQEKESRYAELVKLAVKRQEMQMGKLHKYQDDTYDHILLTPEVVEEANEE